MALIIALVLILILFIRVGPERAEVREINRGVAKRDREVEEWNRTYTDKKLQDEILAYARDPNNREELTAMLKDAFKDLEMWRDYEPQFLKTDDRIFFEQRCTDILLAKQGKLNDILVFLGFEPHAVDNPWGKQRTDEYMFLILSYLRKNGVNIRIIQCTQYNQCNYYFEGSWKQCVYAPLDNKDPLRIVSVYENPLFKN